MLKVERRIKFIWDFRGEFAAQTAKHHAIHLGEFCEQEKIDEFKADSQALNDFHSIAYVVASERYLDEIKNKLKPHRAQISD